MSPWRPHVAEAPPALWNTSGGLTFVHTCHFVSVPSAAWVTSWGGLLHFTDENTACEGLIPLVFTQWVRGLPMLKTPSPEALGLLAVTSLGMLGQGASCCPCFPLHKLELEQNCSVCHHQTSHPACDHGVGPQSRACAKHALWKTGGQWVGQVPESQTAL